MKTVIYSTNTNKFEKKDFITEQLPRCAEYFNKCTQKYTSSEIILALKQPGTFLLDLNLEKDSKYPENLKIYFLEGKSAEEIAEEIIGLKPDLAVLPDCGNSFGKRNKDFRTLCENRDDLL